MPLTLSSRLFFRLIACVTITVFAAPLLAEQYQTNGHSFSVTPLPDWVDWAALPQRSDQRPGQAVAYRLVDRQVNITRSGDTQFSRLVTQPLTEAGLRQAAVIEINFNPAFQELAIHKLSLLRDGQTIDKLRPEQVHLIQREEDFDNNLYDGVITATIIVDDVRLKDSVDLAYSIKGRNPVFGDKYFSAFAMGWSVSIDLARLRVSAPAHRKLYTRSFNAQLEPVVHRNNGRSQYQWSLRDTPAVVEDDDAPVWHQPYPAVQISEYRRWRDVSGWADGLYPHSSELPPALRQTLRQWRKEETDKKRLVVRALKLVQDEVRYFGIELGQNSHRPSLPAEVYTRRYGDCKDKATLLVAVLDQLGITAYPALVSTDHQREIDDWLPTPGLFDHVIVTTELDGKRYWLDGTRNYQQGSLDTLSVPDFERALIVRKGEDRLTPIVIGDSSISGIDTEEEFLVSDYKGAVTLAVKTTYSGALAETMREYFATNTPDAITRSYMNYYAKIYPSITAIKPVATSNDPGDNHFTTQESYRLDGFWETDEAGMHALLIGSSIAPYIRKPDSIRRASPLAVTYPLSVRHRASVVYPEDVHYHIEEPEVRVQDRFVSYRRAVSYAHRKLTVTYDYSTRKDAVMPAQLDDYFSDLNKISNTLQYSTLLADAPAKTNVNAMVDTLLNRLNTLSSK
ncbi:MAG: DUF3857 domain-containing transglutaminase family protein [Thiogranum sp.]|jgi:transglutaminase-like putative cysteine protease|nr:DUF3857 domain-containing transglutaminase family protein [Thiogranum sp.]